MQPSSRVAFQLVKLQILDAKQRQMLAVRLLKCEPARTETNYLCVINQPQMQKPVCYYSLCLCCLGWPVHCTNQQVLVKPYAHRNDILPFMAR